MERRELGRTGEELFPIGVGGFHLLEISDGDALRVMNRFLDEGGNYIETAAQYGGGEAERRSPLSISMVLNPRWSTSMGSERA